MLRRRTAPLTGLVLALLLTGCGGGSEPTDPGTEASPSTPAASEESPEEVPSTDAPTEEADTGTRIEVERAGDAITPNGERVEATVGEPITLVITSDTAGELHVHSTPEQDIAYSEGTSEHQVTIDRPGVVEVESHEPDLVVVQLEVR